MGPRLREGVIAVLCFTAVFAGWAALEQPPTSTPTSTATPKSGTPSVYLSGLPGVVSAGSDTAGGPIVVELAPSATPGQVVDVHHALTRKYLSGDAAQITGDRFSMVLERGQTAQLPEQVVTAVLADARVEHLDILNWGTWRARVTARSSDDVVPLTLDLIEVAGRAQGPALYDLQVMSPGMAYPFVRDRALTSHGWLAAVAMPGSVSVAELRQTWAVLAPFDPVGGTLAIDPQYEMHSWSVAVDDVASVPAVWSAMVSGGVVSADGSRVAPFGFSAYLPGRLSLTIDRGSMDMQLAPDLTRAEAEDLVEGIKGGPWRGRMSLSIRQGIDRHVVGSYWSLELPDGEIEQAGDWPSSPAQDLLIDVWNGHHRSGPPATDGSAGDG